MQAAIARRPTDSEPPKRVFSHRDEADLEWYHCVGQSAFAKSPMGGMLERSENLSETSTGAKVLSVRIWQDKSWGWRQRNTFCGRTCGFIDEAKADLIRRAAQPFVEHLDPTGTALCKAHQQPTQLWVPDDDLLQRYGRVSRRLVYVPRAYRQALEAYYRPEAFRWETYALGRLIVLYGMTEAGERLLANRARRLEAEDVTGPHVFRVRAEYEHNSQAKHPSDLVKRLLTTAERQARDLLGYSRQAYAEAT